MNQITKSNTLYADGTGGLTGTVMFLVVRIPRKLNWITLFCTRSIIEQNKNIRACL